MNHKYAGNDNSTAQEPARGMKSVGRTKPDWLKVRLPSSATYRNVKMLIEEHELHTVCESAACPNRGECWSRSTATFMILGNICTRSCGFCNVMTGRPSELDLDEPNRIARAVAILQLGYVVITSVNRDELKDGGAEIWCKTIQQIRSTSSATRIEALIPDFCGNWSAVDQVLDAHPDILNHNVETVPRLYGTVRPQGKLERSLDLLKRAKQKGFITKSGFMVGLGEADSEVLELLACLRESQVDMVTIGQYLRPSPNHLPVKRYVPPEIFQYFQQAGLK